MKTELRPLGDFALHGAVTAKPAVSASPDAGFTAHGVSTGYIVWTVKEP